MNGISCDYQLPRIHLFARSGQFRAIDTVSLSLARGERVGIVGESGCGKSTLARAILGLEHLQEGEILLDGEPVSSERKISRTLRRKMQVVFQDPYGSFNPRHKVDWLITEPFHLLDAPPTGADRREAIDEALLAVGLARSDARKYIHEFSGGQRQRIAIARALIVRPDLIIFDEAVSALDVSIRARILDLLAEISERYALAYLFISHDLSVVRSVTDRVLVMKAGRIVEDAETAVLFDSPGHSYTRELLEAAPKLPTLGPAMS